VVSQDVVEGQVTHLNKKKVTSRIWMMTIRRK
jgi:hypothetical protein